MFLVKSPLKMTKNYHVAICVILHPDGVQRSCQLPRNHFMSCWVFNFLVQHEVWRNLDFDSIFLPFYRWKWYIFQRCIWFVSTFYGYSWTVLIYIFHDHENISWKNWWLFVTNYCIFLNWSYTKIVQTMAYHSYPKR